MKAIKDVVTQLMQTLESRKESASKDNPELLLKKVLSKKEFIHIKFHYFKKGVLSIKVDSSTWLYYMNMHKEKMLSRLNQESSAIHDVRFRLGEVSRPR